MAVFFQSPQNKYDPPIHLLMLSFSASHWLKSY